MKPLKLRQAAAVASHAPTKVARPMKSKKRKKSKSLWRKVAGEAFDLIEDIFD
ncbi:hypothetical protein [Jannaschia pohangensis]|nr:hypothetical protein [Jannaschia pohangensis]